jgi:serine/threonine-protein kinase
MADLREQLQEILGDTYRLERELSGGMSRVFVAEETALARKVVIKVLPPEMAASVNVARFRREIQLAASLQHPHIVPLLTAGAKGDLLYYVMPLIEGESLRSRLLKRGEFPVSDVAWILRDAASALAYAHAHGVVHRDIKPDNILLTGKFAVVTDFGVAKAVSDATSEVNVTSQGVALGTPTYMAPEQAAADPNTDHRADIYALGVVGYELLAGTPPFTGTSQQMILAAHISHAPENVTVHRPSVPPALANVVMRCLEKRPADRYQTAEELVQQLSVIATSGSTTPAGTEPYITAAKRETRKSHRSMIAAAFVLGLAAFGAVAWFTGRSKPPRFDDHRVIVSDFENLTRDASLDPVGKLASDLLTQSITQTDVAEVAASTVATGDSAKAGLIVRGRYYKESDSVRVQAEILDARTSRVVRAIDPITAAVTSPTKALDQLRPRILGAIASLNDPLIATWARKATQPPLHEAYIAYRAGIDADVVRPGQRAGVTNSAVFAQYSKAIALDSMFILPMMNVTGSPVIAKRFADRDRLTPVDRALIESRMAAQRRDWETAYRAVRQASVLAPDPMILIQLAQYAIYAGRPHEAVSAIKRADPNGKLKFGWGIRTDALHLAGDLQTELAAVERERELGLAMDYEAGQILPALGKVAEVNALINDRMRRASDEEQTPALLMLFAAREYRAHGFVKESDELANRAIAWYRSRPPLEMTPNREFNVISAFLQAGRLQEARSMIEEIIRSDPAARNDPDVIAFLGRIAARTGDSAAARGYMQRLVEVAQSDTTSERQDTQAYNRALIAAGLGDKAMAVALLQQAFAEGSRYEPYLHREIEFQAMQDYPPMKELLWPDG